MKPTFVLLCSLVPTALAGAAPAQDQKDDIVIVCQSSAQLDVRLRCRAAASAAERDWVRFEFDNKTDGPLQLQACWWRLDWAEVHDEKGTLLRTHSGLGQGSLVDLFPRKRPQDPLELPPGVTRSVLASDYATALLGVADAPCLVTPHVVARAFLVGELAAMDADQGPTFSFRWVPPGPEGVLRMRAMLAELLPQPQPPIGSLYLLQMLLKRPEVGGNWSLDELLAVFRPVPHQNAFAPWSMVLGTLDERFATDAKLLDWVLQRLRGDDATILGDLQRMPHVWRPDFLPELLRRYLPPPSPPAAFPLGPRIAANGLVLWLLDQRGAPHRTDAAVCAVLAAPWVEAVVARTPAELEALPADARRERMHTLSEAIRNLGLARDRQQIERLQPWLACRLPLHDGAIGRAVMTPPEPERLCDVALEAILRVLGDDLMANYQHHLGGRQDLNFRYAEARDRQIAALQERLRQPR